MPNPNSHHTIKYTSDLFFRNSSLPSTSSNPEPIEQSPMTKRKRIRGPMKERIISRQAQAYQMIASTATVTDYFQIKRKLMEELKTECVNSSTLKLNLNEKATLDTCGYYQRLSCKVTSASHKESLTKDTLRHHICELCYLLLSEENSHEAAFCTMFKILDEEFKDFPTQPKIEVTLDVEQNIPSLLTIETQRQSDSGLTNEVQQAPNQGVRSQSDPIVLMGTERPWFTSNWAIASAIVDGELV